MHDAEHWYMPQVQRACKLWSGKGGFVFTSSAAVYSSEDGGPCSEDSPLVALGSSERTDRYPAISFKAQHNPWQRNSIDFSCLFKEIPVSHGHMGKLARCS